MNNTSTTSDTSKKTGSPSFGSETGLQDKIMKQIRELGDTLERAGEKVEKSGWETIGQAIYKLGNTLEHLKDGKKGAASDKPFASDKSVSGATAGTKPYTDQEYDEKSKNFSGKPASVGKAGKDESQAY